MADIHILMTNAPYGTIDAEEGLEFALAATNYGHEVRMFFIGDGILQVLKGQQVPNGEKSLLKRLSALPFFDIEECYISSSCLLEKGYSAEDIGLADAILLESPALIEQLRQGDHTVTF